MRLPLRQALMLVFACAWPTSIEAAELPAAGSAQSEPPTAATLQTPLHGLYAEARAGMGYTIVDQGKIPNDINFPTLPGQPEMLGASTLVDATFGYELVDNIAVQLVGGLNFVNGRRDDRVRGLMLAYGGAGVRLALPVSERMLLTLAPAILYIQADTQVDAPSSGVGGMLAFGFDYFVHVRHVSLGIDVTAMLAAPPIRMMLGAAPHIRYTF